MKVDELIPEDCKKLMFREDICYPVDKSIGISMSKVNNALKNACIDYRGWPYIFYLPDSLCPPKSTENKRFAFTKKPFYKYKKFNFWSFDYKNQIFYSKNLTDESSWGNSKLFDPELQVKIISEVLISFGRIFQYLGYSLNKEFIIGLRFSNIKNCKVGSFDSIKNCDYISSEYLGEVLEIEKKYSISSLLNNTTKNSVDLVQDTIIRMGCTRSPSQKQLLNYAEERLKDGKKV